VAKEPGSLREDRWRSYFARLSAPELIRKTALFWVIFIRIRQRAKKRVPNPLVYVLRFFEAWSDSKSGNDAGQ